MGFFRRKHKREPVNDCIIEGFSQKWSCTGRVIDVSEGGMKVHLDEVPDMGGALTVLMNCNSGREMEKNAVVVWFIENVPPETGVTVGLKFV